MAGNLRFSSAQVRFRMAESTRNVLLALKSVEVCHLRFCDELMPSTALSGMQITTASGVPNPYAIWRLHFKKNANIGQNANNI
ncbi:hypothetical protein CEXT_383711 [Caerostris extrusa]|uniref:Uncharacterized protein n=1 Tax=Caerostris extrusa TaxID=172846 RepID=A0AAV4MST9_CAEEX|nr:hypothetical protein CEXT_383711 [Caerostris extrusa]